MTIFLIGYMASGKTTLGRALAKEMGIDFIDLDFYIEQRFHTSVKEIFAREGESRFREIERNMLREVGEMCDVVISCGGGTPCYFDNMDWMNERGKTIWLRASVERIVERLIKGGDKRPIVVGKSEDELRSFVETHLKEREWAYSQAGMQVGSDKLESKRQIAETVKEVVLGIRN